MSIQKNDKEENLDKQKKKIINGYLKQILKQDKYNLNFSVIFVILSLLFFVIQCWSLSVFCSQILDLFYRKNSSLNINLDYKYIYIFIFCFLIRVVLQYFKDKLAKKASCNIRIKLHDELLVLLSKMGTQKYLFGSDGSISSKLLENIDALDEYISRYYVQLILVTCSPFIVLVFIGYYSVISALIIFFTTPLVIIFMIILGKAASNQSRKQLSSLNKLSGQFLDLIRGIKTISLLNAGDTTLFKIEKVSTEYKNNTMKVLYLAFLSSAVLELFASISIALIAVYLGLGLLGILPWDKLQVPVNYQAALFILLLTPEYYGPLRQLGNDYHAKAKAEGAIDGLLPLLNYSIWEHSGIETYGLDKAPSIKVNNLRIVTQDGRVRLQPQNFVIKEKEKVILKGKSGIGKSTILEAILGFIPYDGEILINNKSLSLISRSSWHKEIGYLAQRPVFKSGTIIENLLLAKTNAIEKEIINVLEKVELLDFIMNLPHKLQTRIGERGKGLSGGQLSRLAIAQLLLTNTKLWLLDEPTEHLDYDTSIVIHKLFYSLAKDKTVILINHGDLGFNWIDKVININ